MIPTHPDSLVFSIGDRDSDTKMPLGINGCFLAWTDAFIQAVNVYTAGATDLLGLLYVLFFLSWHVLLESLSFFAIQQHLPH